MAFRRPLYVDGNHNLREMDDDEINEVRQAIATAYINNPSVVLSVTSSGGNLSGLPMQDSRLVAGAYRTFTNRYPTAAELQDANPIWIAYSRINQTVGTDAAPSNSGQITYPVYYTAANQVRAMTELDVIDTFIDGAIDIAASGGQVYSVSTSTSLSGYSVVSTTPIFTNTRANISAYTSAGIPETLDQPTTISNYYLHKRNQLSSPSFIKPAAATGTGDIYTYDQSDFLDIMGQLARYAANSVTGSRIRYNINGTGNQCGTTIVDQRYDGSVRRTRFVNDDDYRAQEHPGGNLIVGIYYYLRVNVI